MPFEGEGFASFPDKIWPPAPCAPPQVRRPCFLEAIINCLCRVRRFVWQAKMTNRKKSIKICVCVHPPIYSSTTTDHLPSLPPTKIISIIINAD